VLNLDEKWSNLPPSVHIVLTECFSLLSGVVAKKMEKLLVLDGNEGHVDEFKGG